MSKSIQYAVLLVSLLFIACSDQLLNKVKSKIFLFDSADITSIVLSAGYLDPDFQSDVSTYTSFMYYQGAQLRVKPTAEHYGATVRVNGNVTQSGQYSPPLPLAAGENTVVIDVTAEDGQHGKSYSITVYRTVGVPRTGQTTSYRDGDDGQLQKGVGWPTSRFTSGGDGTITDKLTGMVWLEDADYFTPGDRGAQIGECNVLEDFGSYPLEDGSEQGDWRMPNRSELRSLFHYGTSSCADWLNAYGFDSVQGSSYWTATGTFVFSLETLNYSIPLSDGYDHNVFPVRDGAAAGLIGLPGTGATVSQYPGDDGDLQRGVPWPDPRFVDNGDGTVTDRLTGLVWLQAGDYFPSQGWNGSVDSCRSLEDDGIGLTDGSQIRDWRLPNVNELSTLLNAGETSGATWLNTECSFTNVGSSDYWTSTTNVNDTGQAWLINLDNARFSARNKGGITRRCLPVRDPQ